ncbi:L-aspartate oxidase [Nafulsella turpanensis]|uniref:L-aspartate oxidase n=1 Tax=Nafulsella turpanensis TaxID=1265690 RepID=UPI000348D170|nr:L-aspartate oxidase [Nafulsella turpanensis]
MKSLQTDVLIVGSGLAGSLLALELADKRPELNILLLNKKEKQQSSSFLAQGGIAAALPGTDDSIKQHLLDTMEVGDWHNNKAVAAYIISQAPKAIQTLEHWGVRFDQQPDGTPALALEGGHSTHRVLHYKDSTGRHIVEKLHLALQQYPSVSLMEDVQVLELLQEKVGQPVSGALAWDERQQEPVQLKAGVVVLATGGLGSLFSYSTNPATASGEGIYLAARAGSRVKDLAFIQFHPTALWQPSGSRLPLISEAVRGAGAVLKNEKGIRFMEGRHPLRDLAPRDVVARNIEKEISRQQNPYVYLDATRLANAEWKQHFPGIFDLCRQAGIDPRYDFIPVVPAAHYSCGGVATSVKGETGVDGLFVIGESACTGLHGANRLASNSLLEATVMAIELGQLLAASHVPADRKREPFTIEPAHFSDKETEEKEARLMEQLRSLLQTHCGILKTTERLLNAQEQLREWKDIVHLRLPQNSLSAIRLNMAIQVARLLIASSLDQTENRGVFFNHDFEKEAAPSLLPA